MIKEEFRTNQTFRYPDEYDKFNQTEEVKMKHIPNESKGLKRPDYEQGANQLEKFKIQDGLSQNQAKQKTLVTTRQRKDFELDLIKRAQAYTVEASKRLNQASGQRKTVRMSLAEIYTEMRQKHPIIIQDEFKLETYGMKEDSETYKKAYPDKFKRHFFHLIKTLNGKPAGKMTAKQVNKNARRLPTTFMVAGTSKRCTIHEYSCPSEPCPYRTHNKKIVMTASLASKEVQNTVETRSRVFYREDKKKEMPAIFMTNEDQLNCRFEPLAGSLNPRFWGVGNTKPSEALLKTAVTEKEFAEKHGPNMKNSHAEVYKKGVLKRAQGLFNKGEYKMALSALMTAFKLKSLRLMFEPNYHEK